MTITRLRDAIIQANGNGEADTINFSVTGTINIGSELPQINPLTSENLTINGPGVGLLTIDASGGNGYRIFDINDPTNGVAPAIITISGMTLTGGETLINVDGGAVKSLSRLALIGVTVEGNASGGAGGAIFVQVAGGGTTSREVLRIENSIIDDNDAFTGGGVAIVSGSFGLPTSDTFYISESTIISNNTAVFNGGGMYAELYGAHLTIDNGARFNSNDAGNEGGGLSVDASNDARVLAKDAVFAQNGSFISGEGGASGGRGGGIAFQGAGQLTLQYVELADNFVESGGQAGGLYVSQPNSPGSDVLVEIRNSQVTGNEARGGSANDAGLFIYQSTSAAIVGIFDTVIENNQALGRESNFAAGRIDSDGTITIERSTITGNYAQDDIGGISIYSGGNVNIKESTISDNVADLDGITSLDGPSGLLLGTLNGAHFTVEETTISGNISKNLLQNTGDPNNGAGGGVYLYNLSDSGYLTRSVKFSNTTISGNQSDGVGGGIAIVNDRSTQLDVSFENSTIVENIADVDGDGLSLFGMAAVGGGIFVGSETNTTVTLKNTIVAKNLRGSIGSQIDDDLNNPLANPIPASYSFIGISTGANITNIVDNQIGASTPIDPLLGPLAFHGGPTQTHAPLFGSPAIDTGDPNAVAGVNGIPEFDQRDTSFSRVLEGDGTGGPRIDIGAHEIGLAKVVDVVLDNPTWGRDPHSFAASIPLGEQLRPFATQNVTQIQIKFSDAIRKRVGTDGAISDIQNGTADGNTLMQLKQTVRNGNGSITNSTIEADDFSYDPQTNVATWSFDTHLADGKYAIHLFDPLGSVGMEAVTGIVDLAGNAMDAEWNNSPTGQPDQWQTHPKRPFATGNGTPGSTNDEFRFHFALLAGDYDGDGIVEHDGEAVTGDGNGDNLVNSTDVTIGTLWSVLPLLQIYGADLNDDEKVDGLDLAIWQTGYGGSVAGDVDGDGDTDGADFLLWQRVYGTYSVWSDGGVYQSYAEAMAASLGLTLEDLTVGLAPQVLNVIISGSQSTHDPFSFDTADGSGSQLATVPVGGADTISIVFSEGVNVSTESLIVVGLTTANVPQLAEFSYDALTYTATWRFEGWALADNYLLYLSDSITDTEGNFLDGEWTNPASISTTNSLVSTFPSGDGISGGSFNFVMTLMPDVNQDNIVNYTDYYYAYYGEWYGVVGDFSNGDFNGNGIVDQEDFDLVSSLMWLSLQDVEILADLDGNGQVDNSDLTIIWTNYGLTGATWDDGDLDGNGTIDDSDLDLAFAPYGLWLEMAA